MLRALHVRGFIPVLAASLVIASPAQAQFGGLLKKAKDAAAGKAVDKAVDKAIPAPRAGGEALTATTFNQVLAGARASNDALTLSDRLREQHKAEQKALEQMESQNQGTRNAYDQANRTIEECRDALLSKAKKKREDDVEARMKTDPQNMARMQMIGMKYGKAMSDAQQRGDTAAYAKAMQAMQAEILGVDIFTAARADSVAADAKCGKLPKLPAALAAQDAKAAYVLALDDSIRTVEARAVTVGAQASGMDKVRYLELKERVRTILGLLAGHRGVVSYNDDEVELVRAHKEEIERLRRAL